MVEFTLRSYICSIEILFSNLRIIIKDISNQRTKKHFTIYLLRGMFLGTGSSKVVGLSIPFWYCFVSPNLNIRKNKTKYCGKSWFKMILKKINMMMICTDDAQNLSFFFLPHSQNHDGTPNSWKIKLCTVFFIFFY